MKQHTSRKRGQTLGQGADSMFWCRTVSRLIECGYPLDDAMKKAGADAHARQASRAHPQRSTTPFLRRLGL